MIFSLATENKILYSCSNPFIEMNWDLKFDNYISLISSRCIYWATALWPLSHMLKFWVLFSQMAEITVFIMKQLGLKFLIYHIFIMTFEKLLNIFCCFLVCKIVINMCLIGFSEIINCVLTSIMLLKSFLI